MAGLRLTIPRVLPLESKTSKRSCAVHTASIGAPMFRSSTSHPGLSTSNTLKAQWPLQLCLVRTAAAATVVNSTRQYWARSTRPIGLQPQTRSDRPYPLTTKIGNARAAIGSHVFSLVLFCESRLSGPRDTRRPLLCRLQLIGHKAPEHQYHPVWNN